MTTLWVHPIVLPDYVRQRPLTEISGYTYKCQHARTITTPITSTKLMLHNVPISCRMRVALEQFLWDTSPNTVNDHCDSFQ